MGRGLSTRVGLGAVAVVLVVVVVVLLMLFAAMACMIAMAVGVDYVVPASSIEDVPYLGQEPKYCSMSANHAAPV